MNLKSKRMTTLSLGFGLALASACNGQAASSAGTEGGAPGGMSTPTLPAPELNQTPADAKTSARHLTLALKMVSYQDAQGQPILSQDQAKKVVDGINALYATCNLSLVLEDYQSVKPGDQGLALNPSTMAELDQIRAKYNDPSRLFVVDTGRWDPSGGLGADGANAWTMMPGEATSGAVLESTVADNAPLVAHELGHYLNLDHVQNPSDMMNPVIYPESTQIESWQCDQMRDAAQGARAYALRQS